MVMVESAPSYLAAPAARQSCALLHRAAQDALGGVASQKVSVSFDGRRALDAGELEVAGHGVLIELQFERPAEVHHSIVVLADAADLVRLFSLPSGEDTDEILPAESLLTLGDIVSTFLDTFVGEVTWLQPTPRAWLANLEPVDNDAGGAAHVTLPALALAGGPLSAITVSVTVDDSVVCPMQVVLGAKVEQALLGLDGEAAPPEQHAPRERAPMPPPTPISMQSASMEESSSTAAPPREVPLQAAGFKPLSPRTPTGKPNPIDLIRDVPLRISVELGRASLTVREVLELGVGSVVELNRLAGEPVDVLVNERLIARGEVVIVDESFGVRITEIVREPAPRVLS